jgi:SAM-dependent methyltransferase
MSQYGPPVTYLNQLAYLLGLEGAALLRGFQEDRDQEFVEARLAEIRALLDTPVLAQAPGVTATPGAITVSDLYREWAPTYDAGGNQMIDCEQPVVRRFLDGVPVGTALDAACGTGRHSAHLAGLGHRVIGVDQSPEMLELARARLPEAQFHQAELTSLPLPDDCVDTVVCALALEYLPDLAAVFAEFARVLRPGGHLVVSDGHRDTVFYSPSTPHTGPDGCVGLVERYPRLPSEYLAAALPLGFQVRGCAEPLRPLMELDPHVPAPDPLPPLGSWDIMNWCPQAAEAVCDRSPIVLVWHFQLG